MVRDKVLFGTSTIQPTLPPPLDPKQEEKMQLSYVQVKERSAAVAAAMADARSARNLASRRRADDARDEREANHYRRRRKRKEAEELLERLRQKVRVRMPQEERPRIGTHTARKLFHRNIDMLFGTTGLTDARGPDGLYSIHYSHTARGFASTKGRRWRSGEAERAALYIVREEALEGGACGWWSSIAADRNELAAFYRTSEAIERHDRSNANVYITEILSLPHELSAEQRRDAVRRICHFFDKRGLPHTVALHLPDPAGDQRNYHVHILYSLRPCERLGPYDWSFAVGKEADINTPEGIRARRLAVVQAINAALCDAGVTKRYTHLSNRARGMAEAQAKIGQRATWIARRLEALEKREVQLLQLSAMIRSVRDMLGRTGLTLKRQRTVAVERLRNLHQDVGIASGNDRTIDLEAAVRTRLDLRASMAQEAIATREGRVEDVRDRTVRAAHRATLLEVRNLFFYATRSLQASQTATDDHLQDLANRVRSDFSESSARQMRLVTFGTTAKKREKGARLAEGSAAIQEFSTVFGDAIDDTRNAVATSMLAMRLAIERRRAAAFSRLTNMRRAIERAEAADRLNAQTAKLDEVMSHAASRMLGARQEITLRLNSITPDILTAAARARRLALVGKIAEQRRRGQQLSEYAVMIKQALVFADRRLDALHQHFTAADFGVTHADPSRENVAPYAPIPHVDIGRDPDRRAAIAAAAWQLRRATFPPQVLNAKGYAIAPAFEQIYRNVDRFESESVIQKVHAKKRAQMLTAVRKQIEGNGRSPFIERDGTTRLPTDIFVSALRHAVSLAIKDRDFIELIDQMALFWRERDAAARKAQIEARARKEREATKRRERMRPRIERVFSAVMARIEDGRYPKPAIAAIKEDILIVTKAVEEGRLAMRSSQDARHFYCATEGLRLVVASLADKPIGREILVALGRLTFVEPFDLTELPVCLALPPKVRPSVPPEVGIDIDVAKFRSKGGAER